MRVSWGSALFSLASASPGRERERGWREDDGAGGKIDRSTFPFINLLSEFLLNAYNVPDGVLDTGNGGVSKTDKNPKTPVLWSGGGVKQETTFIRCMVC